MAVPELLQIQNADGFKASGKMHLTCKTKASNYRASATGVTRQNQMHIESGRHRAWGSLGRISHCASALTQVPEGSFPPIPQRNTWDADVSLARQIPQQMRSWSTAWSWEMCCLLSATLSCECACKSPMCPITLCAASVPSFVSRQPPSSTLSQGHQTHFCNYTNITRSIIPQKLHFGSQYVWSSCLQVPCSGMASWSTNTDSFW